MFPFSWNWLKQLYRLTAVVGLHINDTALTANDRFIFPVGRRVPRRDQKLDYYVSTAPSHLPLLWWWWWWWWRWWWEEEMWTCWASTSASLPAAAPLPPLRVEDEDEEAVDEVVVVVEEVPWIALLIQCSMLMLPSWLDEVPPPPPPSSSSPSPPSSSSPSPWPSPSEPEEVSEEERRWGWTLGLKFYPNRGGKKGSFQTPVQTEVSMCKPYSPPLGKVAAGEEHKLVCACES